MITLRVLATTDVHMNLGTGSRSGGLARLAPIVAEQRESYENLLLFDNGDLIDGSALGDELAHSGLGPHEIHPAIAALNHLGYDAATLGNHDFAHGVEFLRRTMRDARYPLVLSNAGLKDGPALWSETALLRRRFTADDGTLHDMNIGVFGVLPPQTTEWEAGLSKYLMTEDIPCASQRAVSALRARGADIIIALSHGGLGTGALARKENAAGIIAGLEGVDAVIAGHTHEVIVRNATSDCAPVVKAGFGGSHVAAITLWIEGQPDSYRVARTKAEVIDATTRATDADLVAEMQHDDSARRLQVPIGRLPEGLNSHFSLLGTDAGLRLTERATRRHVAENLPHSPLPLLVAIAPFRTGGHAGPEHFVNIPAGMFRRGDLSSLYPFTNHIAVIEVSGADITEWLERAASIFTYLPPEDGAGEARPLLDTAIPGFQFDIIAGIEYEIDLARPAAFDAAGNRQNPNGRLRRIRHQGKPLEASDRFLLATNSYRLSGGPLYREITEGRRCILPAIARSRIRDIIARHITETDSHDSGVAPFFSLSARPGTKVWFDTSPDADISACPLTVRRSDTAANGFRRLTILL